MSLAAVFAYSRLLLRQMAFCTSCKTPASAQQKSAASLTQILTRARPAIRERCWLGCGLCIHTRAGHPESWVASAGQVTNTTPRTDFCPAPVWCWGSSALDHEPEGRWDITMASLSYSGSMLGSENRLGNNYIISLSGHPCYKESTGNSSYAIKAT